MKCPLLREQWREKKEEWISEWADCLKEECADWDEVNMCCGRRTLRKQVERLADILLDIKNKMPHELQSRK